jgi:endonuclease YncB( thermonuclease family)
MGNICYSYSEDTFANAKPFVPQITEGRVVNVYDGDTITIVAKLPYKDSEYYRFSVRLLGIDTAEMRGPEKDRATKARDALSARILNNTVQLRDVTTEKYGRLLANVYLGDECMNKWMLEQGHAIPYNGGNKQAAVIAAENKKLTWLL